MRDTGRTWGCTEIHGRTISCQISASRDQPGKGLERAWQTVKIQTTKYKVGQDSGEEGIGGKLRSEKYEVKALAGAIVDIQIQGLRLNRCTMLPLRVG